MSATYPLAPQGVFGTVQGEGNLLGVPMVFVRFAGCPVNCPGCDTNYTLVSKISLSELVKKVGEEAGTNIEWVWLTGGEPTIHNLQPLICELHRMGLRVALATAGINPVQRGHNYTLENKVRVTNEGPDFLSVSPHRFNSSWVQRRGEQVNIVFGLNGVKPEEVEPYCEELLKGFQVCWVTPCEGDKQSLSRCLEWVKKHPKFRLGIQAHKNWELP